MTSTSPDKKVYFCSARKTLQGDFDGVRMKKEKGAKVWSIVWILAGLRKKKFIH